MLAGKQFLQVNDHTLLRLTVKQSLAGMSMLIVIFRLHCSGIVCGYIMVNLVMVS